MHLLVLALLVAAAMLRITRRAEFAGLTSVPLLVVFAHRYLPDANQRIVLLTAGAALVAAAAFAATRNRLFTRTENVRDQVKLWRFLIRPAAMAFPVMLFVWNRTGTLILLALVTGTFLAIDITRLLSAGVNRFLFRRASGTFKAKELNRLSSMTLFLAAILAVSLVFTRTVALYAVAFMVFGDFAAKFFGLWFGRTPLFSKTLEGTAGHLLACLSVGVLLAEFLPLPLPAVLFAALVATAAEVLPWNIDDNLTVAVLSATALHLGTRAIG